VDHLRAAVQVDVRDRGQRLAVPRRADLHPPVERTADEQQDGVLLVSPCVLGQLDLPWQ